eukprot:5084608-Pyramimonas_sp.AAC.1
MNTWSDPVPGDLMAQSASAHHYLFDRCFGQSAGNERTRAKLKEAQADGARQQNPQPQTPTRSQRSALALATQRRASVLHSSVGYGAPPRSKRKPVGRLTSP